MPFLNQIISPVVEVGRGINDLPKRALQEKGTKESLYSKTKRMKI